MSARNISESSKKEKNSPIVSLLAGGSAGATECTITYPFEFAKTRVQLLYEGGPQNPFSVVAKVIRNEGFTALYSGCASLVIGTIGKDASRFITFDLIKDALADPETGSLTPARSLLAGMAAGVVASAVAVTPSERIKTALIDDGRNEKRFRSTFHATKLILQEHGPLGIYRGFVTTTLKQATTTAVRLGSYNILKEFWQKRDVPQNTAMNFVNGALAGIITVYTTQPFDVVKTRAQSARGAGTIEATTSVMKDYGIKGYWRGSTMRLGRNVFSGAILFTAYEKFVALYKPLIMGTG